MTRDYGDETLRTVYVYSEDPAAYIARGMLESNGIAAVVTHSDVFPVMLTPIGGIELQVRARDYDEACRLLGVDPATGLMDDNREEV